MSSDGSRPAASDPGDATIPVPAPADVRSGTDVMGETGTLTSPPKIWTAAGRVQ